MFKIKTFEGIALAVFFIISPALVSAATLEDLQAQIQALLSQITALQGQIQPVTPTSVSPDQPDDYGTGATQGGTYCPKLSITLQKGSRDASTDGQVSELQTFLTDYYDLDENIVVGGYFGKLTQKYVIEFQNQHGLPAFGIAGSLTRAKIANMCGGVTPRPNSPITVTAPNGGEQWEEGILNTVTWTPYQYNPDINPAKDVTAYLERSFDPGVYETLGKVQESGKASIHWISGELNSATQGGVFVKPGQYYIRVVNNVTGAWDRSDAPFTLLPSATNLGSYRGYMNGQLFISTENISEAEALANCRMNAANNPSAKVRCTWDGNEIFNNGGSAASLQITSPNGGEQLQPNQPYTIKWKQAGLSKISIALYKNDTWLKWIGESAGFSGTEGEVNGMRQWDFNPSVTFGSEASSLSAAGNVYKIYITGQKADGTGYVDDKSDSPFSFTGTVATSTPPVSIGTYRGYLNGALFIETKDVQESYGLENCKLNASNNPTKSIRCTWNDAEIYKESATATSAAQTVWKVRFPSITGGGDNSHYATEMQLIENGTSINSQAINVTATGGADPTLAQEWTDGNVDDIAHGASGQLATKADQSIIWTFPADRIPTSFKLYSHPQGGYAGRTYQTEVYKSNDGGSTYTLVTSGTLSPGHGSASLSWSQSISSTFPNANLANALTALEAAIKALIKKLNAL